MSNKRQNRAVKAADTTVKAEVPASIPATVVVGETAGTVKAEVSLAEVLGAAENLPPVPPTTTPEPSPATEPTPKVKEAKADTRPRGYVLCPGGTVVSARITHTTDGGKGYRAVECDPTTWTTDKASVAFRIPVRDYIAAGEGTTAESACEVFTVRHITAVEYLDPIPHTMTSAFDGWVCSVSIEGDRGDASPITGSGFYRFTPSSDVSTWTLTREGENTPVKVPAGVNAGSPWTLTSAELATAFGDTSGWIVRVVPTGAAGMIVRDVLTGLGETLATVSHIAGHIAARECLSHIVATLAKYPPSL